MTLLDRRWTFGGLTSAFLIGGGLTLAQSPHLMMHGTALSGSGRSEMMDGMHGCMGMMQNGGNQRPNEQWRRRP